MGVNSPTPLPWKSNGTSTLSARQELGLFFRSILTDPVYRDRLKARILAGTASDLELKFAYHYGYGMPTQIVELNTGEQDYDSMPLEQLMDKLEDLKRKVQEAQMIRSTIDGVVVSQPSSVM